MENQYTDFLFGVYSGKLEALEYLEELLDKYDIDDDVAGEILLDLYRWTEDK